MGGRQCRREGKKEEMRGMDEKRDGRGRKDEGEGGWIREKSLSLK